MRVQLGGNGCADSFYIYMIGMTLVIFFSFFLKEISLARVWGKEGETTDLVEC